MGYCILHQYYIFVWYRPIFNVKLSSVTVLLFIVDILAGNLHAWSINPQCLCCNVYFYTEYMKHGSCEYKSNKYSKIVTSNMKYYTVKTPD